MVRIAVAAVRCTFLCHRTLWCCTGWHPSSPYGCQIFNPFLKWSPECFLRARASFVSAFRPRFRAKRAPPGLSFRSFLLPFSDHFSEQILDLHFCLTRFALAGVAGWHIGRNCSAPVFFSFFRPLFRADPEASFWLLFAPSRSFEAPFGLPFWLLVAPSASPSGLLGLFWSL